MKRQEDFVRNRHTINQMPNYQKNYQTHQANQNQPDENSRKWNNDRMVKKESSQTQGLKNDNSNSSHLQGLVNARNKKAQDYKKSIVRQKKQKIFKNFREMNLIELCKVQMNDLQKQLNTTQKRKQFMKLMIENFEYFQNEPLIIFLDNVFLSLKAFYMNNKMWELVEGQVVDKLCILMEPGEFKNIVYLKAVYLMQRMIECEPKILDYMFEVNHKNRTIRNLFRGTFLQGQSIVQPFNCVDLLTLVFKKNPTDFLKIMSIQRTLECCIRWLMITIERRQNADKILARVYPFLIELSKEMSQKWNTWSEEAKRQVKNLLKLLNQNLSSHQSFQNHFDLITIIYHFTQQVSTNHESEEVLLPNLSNCYILGRLPSIMEIIIYLTCQNFIEMAFLVKVILTFSCNVGKSEKKCLIQVLKDFSTKDKENKEALMHANTYSQKSQHTIALIHNFLRFFQTIYESDENAAFIMERIIEKFKKIKREYDLEKKRFQQRELDI